MPCTKMAGNWFDIGQPLNLSLYGNDSLHCGSCINLDFKLCVFVNQADFPATYYGEARAELVGDNPAPAVVALID
jgi:hypothetical protein